MKTLLLYTLALIGVSQFTSAQVAIDTVETGTGYTQNSWYSLENGDVSSAANNNWDLALATTISQTNGLTTAILFNHKVGSLYEVPGSDPANFSNIDTNGLSTWTPLFNSDSTWAVGAFNATNNLGTFDYGWGTYDMVTHSGIQANRVFVIKYTDGSFKKIKIDLNFAALKYVLTFSNLDNSASFFEDLVFSAYSNKNFIYFSLANGIIDREPLSDSWDLTFMQYPSFDYNPPYMVAGVLQNVGVKVAQVYPVNNVDTYFDWGSATFSENTNVIGYDWKNFGGTGWTIADSTVYFIKTTNEDIWKVVMTGFTGSSTGKYIFSKEKISSASIEENVTSNLFVYPNPAADLVNILVDSKHSGELTIVNSLGKVIQKTQLVDSFFGTHTLSTQDLPNGTYSVVFNTQKNQIVKQLIIIK